MLDKMSRLIKNGGNHGKAAELVAEADALRKERAWESAAELYKSALEADPTMAHIWVQYGHALKESGHPKHAEAAYLEALKLKDEADTHLQLGHLHKIMGRLREAQEDYLHAFERLPDYEDARLELNHMGWSNTRLRAHVASRAKKDLARNASESFITFELSDLVDHFQHTPYPSGIQRVQLELGTALAKTANESRVQFVYYDQYQSDFFEIPFRMVLDIAYLIDTLERGDSILPSKVEQMKKDVVAARPFEFPNNAYLVNVGTSWGFINYFMTIRDLKQRKGLRYVPLVHDCIPILFPEFCNPNLVCDFINWITLMIGDADFILTNSENTKTDLYKLVGELHASLPPTQSIYLNGEYRDRAAITNGEFDRSTIEVLQSHNLDVDEFVLFVSTIEPRKNHMLALNAWSHMLKTRPFAKVPRLVCVGNSGWMNDAFSQRLETDELLRSRVVVMRNVSDQVLQLLYRKCMFTLFPSLYEGWGLPISEALAHGKIPLVSKISSHPEAGGNLAVYFDVRSGLDFQTKLEALIDEPEMRQKREREIASAKPLRPWTDIAKEIFDEVDAHYAKNPARGAEEDSDKGTRALACGRYYSFARNRASKMQDLACSGDVYRAGTNWHPPEPWGCWVRGLTTEIAFHLSSERGDDFLLYLHWTGSNNIDNVVTLSLPPSALSKRVGLPRSQDRWEVLPFSFKPGSKREVRLRMTAERLDDFAQVSDGRDRRISSFGVRGIFVCGASDTLQRLSITEAIQLNNIELLARRFPENAIL